MGPALCIQTTRSSITPRPAHFAGRKDAIPRLFLELTEASISQESPQVSWARKVAQQSRFHLKAKPHVGETGSQVWIQMSLNGWSFFFFVSPLDAQSVGWSETQMPLSHEELIGAFGQLSGALSPWGTADVAALKNRHGTSRTLELPRMKINLLTSVSSSFNSS